MTKVEILMNRYYDAAEKYRKAINSAGSLRPDEDMTGPKVPISRHPPYLMEKLVRDDTVNQFVLEKVPFSALIAPVEYDLHASEEGRGDSILSLLGFSTDASEFNAKYGVSDGIDVPVASMPESFINGDLANMLLTINDESLIDKKFSTKCEELTDFIFDFDKLAQDIPTNYWPQVRAGEKVMREFIECAKIHEIFSNVFSAFGVNPRRITDGTSIYYGNNPLLSVKDYVSNSNVTIPKYLSVIEIAGEQVRVIDPPFDLKQFFNVQVIKRKVTLPEFFSALSFRSLT
jgi:hypothetical protein